MNEKNFCNWLQSAFNLKNVKEFSPKQTTVIKEHLDLVLSSANKNEINSFCNWLQGFFDFNKPTEINAAATEIIRNKLSMHLKKIEESEEMEQYEKLDVSSVGGFNDVIRFNQEQIERGSGIRAKC